MLTQAKQQQGEHAVLWTTSCCEVMANTKYYKLNESLKCYRHRPLLLQQQYQWICTKFLERDLFRAQSDRTAYFTPSL